MRREKLPSWRWPHVCIYTHVCKHTHTRIHGHTCCAPQHKYISPHHHHHRCFSNPAGEGPRRSRPPPRAGMAHPSLYLPIPFPLLGPPGRSIQFTQQTRGALLCAKYWKKNLSLKRKKRGKAEGKEATCTQQCLHTEEHVLGACVRVHAHTCAHVHSRAY